LRFRDDRDWAQFHTPKNLAAALSIEAAELQETMLWKTDAEISEMRSVAGGRDKLAQEVADVLIFAVLFCEATGIDAAQAIRDKLATNAAKYPVEKARGRATKYTEL
jgi:NTP pyrophosphatase (non-canonical NTP hydrolase)